MTTRIVLIEDDPDIAELIEELLRDGGYEIDARANLDDGLGDDEARLVITDLVGVRGYDIARARAWISRVRALFPSAAVMVSTAHAHAAVSGAEALGADAVVSKPFDFPVFLQTVESLLGA